MTRDEKIYKLAKVITDRKEALLGIEKLSPDSPEYWGINRALIFVRDKYGVQCEEDTLDLALKMKKRKPVTFGVLKERTGWDDERLTKALDCICDCGLGVPLGKPG